MRGQAGKSEGPLGIIDKALDVMSPDLRSRCRMLCACRCSMPLAAPQHMAATCAHVISSMGECSIPYSDPLHAQQFVWHLPVVTYF